MPVLPRRLRGFGQIYRKLRLGPCICWCVLLCCFWSLWSEPPEEKDTGHWAEICKPGFRAALPDHRAWPLLSQLYCRQDPLAASKGCHAPVNPHSGKGQWACMGTLRHVSGSQVVCFSPSCGLFLESVPSLTCGLRVRAVSVRRRDKLGCLPGHLTPATGEQ